MRRLPKENEPTAEQFNGYVQSPLWGELSNWLQQIYNIKPLPSFSNCNMDKGFWKGWHVKFKKSGKALCTLYPKDGHFYALVVVGEKESVEAELLIPMCCEYTQELYASVEACMGGKWLMFEVKNDDILRDIKELVIIRVKPKPKK